jgi:hypothetical protein
VRQKLGVEPGTSRQKLRIHNTDLNNLVSNLRGEIGEIVFSWTLMRELLTQARHRRDSLGIDELSDAQLNTLHALADKLEDEVVARLSELAERKIGRLTFHFASEKLCMFEAEVRLFQRFIDQHKFTDKRNSDISHKELPEKWSDHRYLHIPYAMIVRGIAMAMRLMKRIDDFAVGPEARFFWRKLRERRYDRTMPAKVQYMIAPHIKLSEKERAAVMKEEMKRGQVIWEPMQTVVNGQQAVVLVHKKWGVVAFND